MLVRESYFRIDDRYLTHPGVILDIGCLQWDWSSYFFDKNKKVIGFDCNEQAQPNGAELRRQIVLDYDGESCIYGNGTAATTIKFDRQRNRTNGIKYKVVSLNNVLSEFKIMPSIVKMNIEGGEYALLESLKSYPSDQLVVSFHDWEDFPFSKDMSVAARNKLAVWYDWQVIYEGTSWWLGLLKDEYRCSV